MCEKLAESALYATPLELSHREAEAAAYWYARGHVAGQREQVLTFAELRDFATLYADTRGAFNGRQTQTGISAAFHNWQQDLRLAAELKRRS